jgi:site-specific recombinase XerC
MAARKLGIRSFDEGTIAEFDEHLSRCRCRTRLRGRSSGAAAGARRFLAYLRETGLAAGRPPAPLPPLITAYCAWAKSHRGVQESSLVQQRRYLGRFLKFAGAEPSRFDVRTLRRFALSVKIAKTNTLSTLRMFIRFLVAVGKCKPGLDEAIPAIAQWRLSSLPRYLPRADVEQVIGTAPYGSRDRAVLLLLARLGLRRGDIVGLEMSDIDWTRGVLRVVGKSRREAYLPLPQDVGNAILAYLRSKSRRQADSDRVFVSTPWGRPLPCAVSEDLAKFVENTHSRPS